MLPKQNAACGISMPAILKNGRRSMSLRHACIHISYILGCMTACACMDRCGIIYNCTLIYSYHTEHMLPKQNAACEFFILNERHKILKSSPHLLH